MKNLTEQLTFGARCSHKVLKLAGRCHIKLMLPACCSALVMLVPRDFRCNGTTLSNDGFLYSP